MGKLIQIGFKLNSQDCITPLHLTDYLEAIHKAGCNCVQIHISILNKHSKKKEILEVLAASKLQVILHMISIDDIFCLSSLLDEKIKNIVNKCIVHIPYNGKLTKNYIKSIIAQFKKFGIDVFFENEIGCSHKLSDWYEYIELENFNLCLDIAHDYLSTGQLSTNSKIIARAGIVHIHGVDPLLRRDHLNPYGAEWNPIMKLHDLWSDYSNKIFIFEIKNSNIEIIDTCINSFSKELQKRHEPGI